MDKTLLVFFSTQIIVWLCYMLPVPILPEVAEQRHITKDVVGIILSVYTITYILASFVLAKMMVLWGKVRFLFLTMTILFFTTFLFGIMMLVKEKNMFIVVTCLLRLAQGLACGGYGVIIYSMVPQFYPDRVEEILSYMEIFGGLSTALSPLIGMILYNLVGPALTFVIFSFVYLILLVLIYHFVDLSKADESKKNEGNQVEEIGLFDVLKNTQYLVTFCTFAVNLIGFFIVNPILGDRVKEITGSTDAIGLCFSMFCMLYAVVGIFLGQLFKKYKINKKTLFILSSLILILSYFIMSVTNNLFFLQISLLMVGLAEALVVIPFIPEAMEIGLSMYPNNHYVIGDIASAYWNIGFAIGEFLGPLLGGYLGEVYGFQVCTFIYSIMVLIMLFIYLSLGHVLTRLTPLEERLLTNYGSFGLTNVVKFNTFDLNIYRTRPAFLKSI